jgi:replication initiation and membrane attachment protein DnaB
MQDKSLEYTIETSSPLLEGEEAYIFDFYLPIIGYKAVFLYLYLRRKVNDKIGKLNEDEIDKETYMSNQVFLFARRLLESVGLLNTYSAKDGNLLLVLVNPLSPSDFVSDVVLKGLFISIAGEDRFVKLSEKYLAQTVDLKSYKEITSSITDNFKVDFDPNIVKIDPGKVVVKNRSYGKLSFDEKKFYRSLKKAIGPIVLPFFSDIELKVIGFYNNLFGYEEDVLADIVGHSINDEEVVGKKLDIEKFKKNISSNLLGDGFYKKKGRKVGVDGDSEVALKIELYESTAAEKFMLNKQDGAPLSSADKNLIEDLAYKFHLSNGVINALTDYVLEATNGQFNRSYVEKLATSLLRAHVEDALSAYRYLRNSRSSSMKNSLDNFDASKHRDIDPDKDAF